jgi:beta-galactosidase
VACALGREGRAEVGQGVLELPERRAVLKRQFLRDKDAQQPGFPAAGLRWLVRLREGENRLRVVARKGGSEVTDEIVQQYETRQWGKPARFELREIDRKGDAITVQAHLFDANGVPCLDAHNMVRFSLAGPGELVDNLGTSTGSRAVEMYNGRAIIRVNRKGGESTIAVASKELPAAFLRIA